MRERKLFWISIFQLQLNIFLLVLDRKVSKQVHSVEFSGQWDKVTNKPTIILEATGPNEITVTNQPNTVNLQKVKYEPKIKPKKKKPNIELIVGVTIGVVAVVAIVAEVCVYFFVYKKRKVARAGEAGIKP